MKLIHPFGSMHKIMYEDGTFIDITLSSYILSLIHLCSALVE